MRILNGWLPSAADYPESRLFSLDLLRGLDMFLLTVIGPMMWATDYLLDGGLAPLYGQFRHCWRGFSLWDIIMPMFIFMCGAAMPFALGKRLKAGRKRFWKHVIARVALLWILGGLVQGDWASLDPLKVAPFSNTLQAIAIGYLVTAALMCAGSWRTLLVAATACFVVYGVSLACAGDYSEFGNFAFRVESRIRAFVYPQNHARLLKPSFYTWYFTSLMFAFMTVCGYLATEILRSGLCKWRKAYVLLAYGAGLLLVGYVLSAWIPLIKPIFTVSFTAAAMGWCVLSLGVLYVVTDILRIRFGTSLILLFGQCALVAYFVPHFFRKPLVALADTLAQGVLPRLGEHAAYFVREALVVSLVVVIMAVWRRLKMAAACNRRVAHE